MENGKKLLYNIDLAFCIDVTGSMQPIIDIVKNNALKLYGDIVNKMREKGKNVNSIRVRIVAFRDYLADGPEAMLTSDFFQLPEQAQQLSDCVRGLDADGGGDIPEDGMEALAYAIRSDWSRTGTKRRHVIVLWTDAPSHEIGYGKASDCYPKGMPSSFAELSNWWRDEQSGGYMEQRAKRLLMFAPESFDGEETAWSRIQRTWDQSILAPAASEGLSELDYDQILAQIGNTI